MPSSSPSQSSCCLYFMKKRKHIIIPIIIGMLAMIILLIVSVGNQGCQSTYYGGQVCIPSDEFCGRGMCYCDAVPRDNECKYCPCKPASRGDGFSFAVAVWVISFFTLMLGLKLCCAGSRDSLEWQEVQLEWQNAQIYSADDSCDKGAEGKTSHDETPAPVLVGRQESECEC